MMIVRRYRCDEGHEWFVRREESEGEVIGDDVCRHGHVAVTCRVEPPVHDVQVVIRPAARLVDEVKGQRILNDRYYLSLLNRAGVEICSTLDHYGWEEAMQLASFFRNKSPEQALVWWEKRKL